MYSRQLRIAKESDGEHEEHSTVGALRKPTTLHFARSDAGKHHPVFQTENNDPLSNPPTKSLSTSSPIIQTKTRISESEYLQRTKILYHCSGNPFP